MICLVDWIMIHKFEPFQIILTWISTVKSYCSNYLNWECAGFYFTFHLFEEKKRPLDMTLSGFCIENITIYFDCSAKSNKKGKRMHFYVDEELPNSNGESLALWSILYKEIWHSGVCRCHTALVVLFTGNRSRVRYVCVVSSLFSVRRHFSVRVCHALHTNQPQIPNVVAATTTALYFYFHTMSFNPCFSFLNSHLDDFYRSSFYLRSFINGSVSVC